jgi:hypothetical protein
MISLFDSGYLSRGRRLVPRFLRCGLALLLSYNVGCAENPAPAPISSPPSSEAIELARKSEQVRAACIEGRRYVAGRVLLVLPEGLVVDSGYSRLLEAPLNHSWLTPAIASLNRDPHAVEENKADAICIGPVFLSHIPKRPTVKPYDYVVLHGYPAGEFTYSPVPGIQKTVRRFSASLDRAVQINLNRESKPSGK